MAQSVERCQAHVDEQQYPRSPCRLCCHLGSYSGIPVRRVFRVNLIFILRLVRGRFRQNTEIRPRLISELFPTLVNIASQMMQTPPSAALEIPAMLRLILKTYKTSISVELSAHQQTSDSIMSWGRLLFAVVNLQLPKEAAPEDEEEREKSEWWRAKKWAYAVLGALFHQYIFFLCAYMKC